MASIQIELPDEVLISLKETPEAMSQGLSIFATVKLFELGQLSSGRAAQLAQVSRIGFLNLPECHQVSLFTLSSEDLEQDVLNA